nr:hypothetical protein [uncultured Parolsenella sp.]
MPGTEFVSSEGHPSIASFFGADDVVKVIYAGSDFAMLRELGERQRPELAAHGIGVTYSSGRYVEFAGAGVNKGAVWPVSRSCSTSRWRTPSPWATLPTTSR